MFFKLHSCNILFLHLIIWRISTMFVLQLPQQVLVLYLALLLLYLYSRSLAVLDMRGAHDTGGTPYSPSRGSLYIICIIDSSILMKVMLNYEDNLTCFRVNWNLRSYLNKDCGSSLVASLSTLINQQIYHNYIDMNF